METWRGSYSYRTDSPTIGEERRAKDILDRQLQETLFAVVNKNAEGFVVISPVTYWHEPAGDVNVARLWVEAKIGHSQTQTIYIPDYKFFCDPKLRAKKLTWKQRFKAFFTGKAE